MLLTLICKKRENENGNKWINYSTLRGKKWYNVRFVKDCVAPQPHKVADGIARAFIELDNTCVFNFKDEGKNTTLFVESFKAVAEDKIKELITAEGEKIAKYREQKEREKMDFLNPLNDSDAPFEF